MLLPLLETVSLPGAGMEGEEGAVISPVISLRTKDRQNAVTTGMITFCLGNVISSNCLSAQSSSLNVHITTPNRRGCLEEAFPLRVGRLGAQGAEALAMPRVQRRLLGSLLVDLARIHLRFGELRPAVLHMIGQSELGG